MEINEKKIFLEKHSLRVRKMYDVFRGKFLWREFAKKTQSHRSLVLTCKLMFTKQLCTSYLLIYLYCFLLDGIRCSSNSFPFDCNSYKMLPNQNHYKPKINFENWHSISSDFETIECISSVYKTFANSLIILSSQFLIKEYRTMQLQKSNRVNSLFQLCLYVSFTTIIMYVWQHFVAFSH